jgi:hypothetical protein
MDIVDRLNTVWSSNYKLQPTSAEERQCVIEIQQLKKDAAKEVTKLHHQVTALEARNKKLVEVLEGVTDSLISLYQSDVDTFEIERLKAKTQEPVGTTYISRSGYMEVELHRTVDAGVPLYTTPPSREWQSLSDDEIIPMYNEPSSDAEMIEFARSIEAKLRERNR